MDKYDEEIERLVKLDSDDLSGSWGNAEPLFQYCTPSGRMEVAPWSKNPCGCLTMIREFYQSGISDDTGSYAWTRELTDEISGDEKLPCGFAGFLDRWDAASESERRAILQPFAEWQRRLDREIRGVTA